MKIRYDSALPNNFEAFNEIYTVTINNQMINKKGKFKIGDAFEFYLVYTIVTFILLLSVIAAFTIINHFVFMSILFIIVFSLLFLIYFVNLLTFIF